ncbi:MAG: nitroreductase family protein [Proteocatella sp.]
MDKTMNMWMKDIDAIDARESRRIYLDREIDIKKMIKLKQLINKFNEEANLKISLIDDARGAFSGFKKSYGFFKGVRSVIALKGYTGDVLLKEKLGFYGEKLVIEAVKMNLGTCWVWGTFDSKSTIFDKDDDETLICVITIGYCNNKKSFREKLIYNITHRKTKEIDELYNSGGEQIPQWFQNGMKAVQKAPSAKNRQIVIFEYKGGKASAFVDEVEEFDLVDLGIAKLHFSVGAGGNFEFGNPGEFSFTK